MSAAAAHRAAANSAQEPLSSIMPIVRGATNFRCESRTHCSARSCAADSVMGVSRTGRVPGSPKGSHSRTSFISALGKSGSGWGVGPSDSVRSISHR